MRYASTHNNRGIYITQSHERLTEQLQILYQTPINMTYRLFLCSLSICFLLANAQIVNPIPAPILPSNREVHVRSFAQIPRYNGAPAKLIGMTNLGESLYVTTSTSGGRIYRVFPGGRVSLWFDVDEAIRMSTGRSLSFTNRAHGGLRGIAFHPKYRENGFFYVSAMEDRNGRPLSDFNYLTTPPSNSIPADSVVLEFQVNVANRVPIKTSYREVLRIAMPHYDHPVKQIAFKGKNLYVAHGDGSVQSAIIGGGQNNDGLGKILRINPLRRGSRAYTIPRNNPFVGNPRYIDEIYAVGFRNPHNICFGRSPTNRAELWVADAGRDNVEEINLVKSGRNYGWSRREGPFRHLLVGGLMTGIAPLLSTERPGEFEYPVAVYGHESEAGAQFIGQAIAGSCPIQNGSPLNGILMYANFPSNGKLYFSFLNAMRAAVTSGRPQDLTMARTYQPKIFFDHDSNPNTPPIEVNDLQEIVVMDSGLDPSIKAHIRFGRGKRGEIYWTSKANGKIYLITSSVPTSTS